MTVSQNATASGEREGESSDASDGLESDDLFYLLGNDRRRSTVEILARERRSVDVSDLAHEIVDGEDSSYKSAYVSLQQSHLPQLDEHGVVVYDRDEREVQCGPHFDEVASYVGSDESTTQHWQIYFAGAVVSLLATGGSALLTQSDGFVTAGVAAAGLLALVGYAAYQTFAVDE